MRAEDRLSRDGHNRWPFETERAMTIGSVSANNEAVVAIRLRSADGAELTIDAILDTGFSGFLTLSPNLIDQLAWPYRDSTPIVLADGTPRDVDVFEGLIRWNDAWRSIRVQASDGGTLLGMGLLRDHLVSIEVIMNGSVTVEPLE
jgi:clan AA aspartic protease